MTEEQLADIIHRAIQRALAKERVITNAAIAQQREQVAAETRLAELEGK